MLKLNKTNIFFGLLIILAISLIGCLVFVIIRFQDEPTSDSLEIDDSFENNLEEPEEIGFEIIRGGTIQHDFILKKTYEIVIKDTDEESVMSAAEQIIEDKTKENNDIDEIHLIFFSDKELIETEPFDVAQAIWGPMTMITQEIAENNLRDNYYINLIMKGSEDRSRENAEKLLEELENK